MFTLSPVITLMLSIVVGVHRSVGYVAAAVGLLAGVTFLGERYALLTWTGAAIIACGVVMTTKASGRYEK